MTSVRVHFQLEPDDDGYPPVSVETVWAQPSGQAAEFTLLNTPFFVRTATLGDTVLGSEKDGVLWYVKTIAHCGNSLLRLVFFDTDAVQRVSEMLEAVGCTIEYLPSNKLLAVSVPKRVALESVQTLIRKEAEAGLLDFEEPLLMQ